MANRQEFSRTDRIRKAVIREFNDILREEVKHPGLADQLISVTDAEVTNDLSYVRIYVSVMGDEETKQNVMTILQESTPKIRSAIGHRIRMRHTPEISIRFDDSLERGVHVTQLLNQIARGEV